MLLIVCSVLSLLIANLPAGNMYVHYWETDLLIKPMHFWINDVLMSVFFLLVGLEIEREMQVGELRNLKNSMLPISAAIGGMLIPALFHFIFNFGLPTQDGMGIPMATDIAFSLAILSVLGKRVPISLKIFLTALAIIDDLGSILVIALFYSGDISYFDLLVSLFIFLVLMILNRKKIDNLWIYFSLGVIMWIFMYRSGIHPTISGVMLAFAIPFSGKKRKTLSEDLQHILHKPVAFLILPIFALANTAIIIPDSWKSDLFSHNSLGIMTGLVLGKPIGIFLFSWLSLAIGVASIPRDLKLSHLFWTGLIAGIGFTMSIFITLLAFNDAELIDSSKMAVMIGSLIAGCGGLIALSIVLPKSKKEEQPVPASS